MAQARCKNGHIYDSAIYGDRCPYCDHKFAKDQALEDFLLAPTVKAWIQSQDMLPLPFRMDDMIEPE